MRLRTYNRKTYTFAGWDSSKASAELERAYLKKQGYNVIIIKSQLKRRGYEIWRSLNKAK